jgi:Putative zinc binding domain
VGNEPCYPLRVVFCHDCHTAQLDYTVPKEAMFSDHTCLSHVTKSLSDHFHNVAAEVDEPFFQNTPGKSVMDIGSNYQALLAQHRGRAARDAIGTIGLMRVADCSRYGQVHLAPNGRIRQFELRGRTI